MISAQIINKSKTRNVLLVHGLFTSSGYWLSYLEMLREYRLIILQIDYDSISDFSCYIHRAMEIIQTEAQGRVDAVIAHSLGTFIACHLPTEVYRYSFQICPVYTARRLNPDNFIAEIQSRSKALYSEGAIRKLLGDVDAAIALHGKLVITQKNTLIYLPDEDSYFSYQKNSSNRVFKGDHFNIACALKDIREILAV